MSPQAYSGDGATLAAGSNGGEVCLWDVAKVPSTPAPFVAWALLGGWWSPHHASGTAAARYPNEIHKTRGLSLRIVSNCLLNAPVAHSSFSLSLRSPSRSVRPFVQVLGQHTALDERGSPVCSFKAHTESIYDMVTYGDLLIT